MIYLLIILALLSAYREVQILIERGSWRKEDYRNIFWKTNWKSWLKNLDSFHVSNGLFVLVMFFAMASKSYVSLTDLIGLSLVDIQPIGIAIDVIIYWFGFMYVRNIGLHIIFKKKPIYSYLLFWKMK